MIAMPSSLLSCRRLFDAPPRGQKPTHLGSGEAIVDQVHNAAIRWRPNHSSGGLNDLSDSGEEVRVVVTRSKVRVDPAPILFVDRIELR